jgi:phospholipase/carboxylesterase
MEHGKNAVYTGVPLEQAQRILLMLHGRGATAEDIISLTQYLNAADAHIIAPRATGNTWYPYSFLAPVEQNEPWLGSAIAQIDTLLEEVYAAGRKSSEVVLLGFSQGACLSLEYAARNAQEYGGVVAFTGGLIGNTVRESIYRGDFKGTKVFIGNSDRDPHVPLVRSVESKAVMEKLGADVTLKVYPSLAHTINEDEINWVNTHILS